MEGRKSVGVKIYAGTVLPQVASDGAEEIGKGPSESSGKDRSDDMPGSSPEASRSAPVTSMTQVKTFEGFARSVDVRNVGGCCCKVAFVPRAGRRQVDLV